MPKKAEAVKKPTISIPSAFHEAQLSFAKHRKCIEALQAARAVSEDVGAWDDEFFACVATVLPVYKREPAAERIVEFVVQFATQHGGEEDVDEVFVEKLVNWLVTLVSHKDKAVRFRVTQIVGRIMNMMKEEAEVSDELFETIETAMLTRCKDKVPLVRAWALKGLFRLQDPSNGADGITTELLRLMSEDDSKEVRMAAISTVAPSRHAIRALLMRTRDASEEVRLHALSVLRDKVEMRWLSISQRVYVLENSLLDRTPTVAKACADMLAGGWLRKACENDVLKLLRSLDSTTNQKACQMALDILLSREPTTRDLVGKAATTHWSDDGADLQPEAAICLRAHLEWLAAAPGSKNEGNKPDMDALEEAAPDVPELCDVLRKAADACEERGVAGTCVLTQLASAAKQCIAHTDETGRGLIEQLSSELLRSLSTPDDALSALFGALEASCIDEKERFQRLVCEIISEVEDPCEASDATDTAEADARLQREQSIMFAQARLGELKAEIAAKITEEEDMDGAEQLKAEAKKVAAKLAELERAGGDAPEVVFARDARCLRLSALLLQTPVLKLEEHEVAHLPERFLPALTSPHVELRELGVKCLGLHCHTSARVARSFFPMLTKALQVDSETVQLAALRATIDLLLLHSPAAIFDDTDAAPADTAAAGTSTCTAEVEAAEKAAVAAATAATAAGAPLVRTEDPCAPKVGALLSEVLEQPSGVLRTTAALGLCKLLHAGALRSSSLLARLLITYFTPPTDGADQQVRKQAAELSQSLAVFFAASGKASGLASALVPAMRTVFRAAPGSSDAEVSVESIVSFVVGICDDSDSEYAADAGDTNVQLAAALCCECLLALQHGADGDEARVLPKAFASIALPAKVAPTRVPALAALRSLLGELADELEGESKTMFKHVTKMSERVDELVSKSSASSSKSTRSRAGAAEADASGTSAVDVSDGAAADSGASPAEMTSESVLDAYKALRDADEAACDARRHAVLQASIEESSSAQPAPRRRLVGPSAKSADAAPARRKMPKSKAVGLTPSKAHAENADSNVLA